MKKTIAILLTVFMLFTLISGALRVDVVKADSANQRVTMNNGLFGGTVLALAIDLTNTQIIYVGTETDGVFKSTDGGITWTQIGLTNKSVGYLAISPTNTKIIYAGADGEVFKSANAGTTWTQIQFKNMVIEIYSLAIDPTNTQVIYAGTWGSVFKCTIVQFAIHASAGSGGSISPSGTITVNYGDSKTFTITPDKGYKISDVKVDDKSVGAVSTYTFSNITDNHTI